MHVVQETFPLQKVLSEARGYGLALVSASAAMGGALLLDSYGFSDVAIPLLLLALGIVVWYGGPGPAILALVLSSFAFNYFFTEPLYSLYITPADLPQFVIFIVFASLFTWFSTVRRRIEQRLLLSQADLEKEVLERTRRAEEVRALNQELEKRGRELEASNKELEAFAYSVSHDLRAPLRHMVGFTALLQKGASARLDDKNQRYVTMILESAKRMGTLIDDLLAFSRIGRAETHKTTVSLQQLVQEALAEVQQETDGRNIVWDIGTLPTWYGDRSMLRLVLVNLISNAVKFTRTRTQAEIEVACTEQRPDHVVVCVRDNGVGFDMQYANKLFGVFQRLHAAEAFEGTGIGLATVQRIVHRHGGRVWAEGAVDKGAAFYFSLSKPRGA
jgi:signal transduction histidine kinase